MVARSERYDLLARLLDYPEQGGYPEMLARCIDESGGRLPRSDAAGFCARCTIASAR